MVASGQPQIPQQSQAPAALQQIPADIPNPRPSTKLLPPASYQSTTHSLRATTSLCSTRLQVRACMHNSHMHARLAAMRRQLTTARAGRLGLVAEHGLQPALSILLGHALAPGVLVHLVLRDLAHRKVARLGCAKVQPCMCTPSRSRRCGGSTSLLVR